MSQRRNTRQAAAANVAVANNNSTANTKNHTDINMSAKVELILKEQTELRKSQEFLSASYEEAIKELKQCREANKNLRNEMASIVQKQSDFHGEIAVIKAKVNVNEQSKIINNVLIRGIAETEPVEQAVKKIANLSEVQLVENDIDYATQLKYKNKEPAIMVKFKNETKRHEFVRAAKGKKISTAMYGYSGDARPIFVDPQLTRESFALFKHAKKLKKIGVAFIWISINGEILIREKPNTAIMNIKTAAQVDEIEREIILRTKSPNTNNGRTNVRPNGTTQVPRADNGDERANAKSTQCNKYSHNHSTQHNAISITNTANGESKRNKMRNGSHNHNETRELHGYGSSTDGSAQRNTNARYAHDTEPNAESINPCTAHKAINITSNGLTQTPNQHLGDNERVKVW